MTGIFSLMYVPSKLFVSGNSAVTYQNIISAETLFRLGIVSGLLCYSLFLFLPIVLYKLLKPVNENFAALMVILAVVSVPISFINMQNRFAILSLISGPVYPNVFSTAQIQSQVSFYLETYDNGILIVSIFWGLWLFPFVYLVFKSGMLPKVFGILLMLSCFSYLINFLGNTLISDYSKLGIFSYTSLPASVGEIGTCLWLLFVGTKDQRTV